MGGSLNKVQLIGNVGRDPEMRYLQSGEAVTTFSLATNRRWMGPDGAPREETEWHQVVADRMLLLDSRGDRPGANGQAAGDAAEPWDPEADDELAAPAAPAGTPS